MTVINESNWSEWVEHAAVMTGNERNRDFKQWLESKKHFGRLFDYNLYARAYVIQNRLKDDYDHITVICGYEGEGKSTLARLYCAIISPTLNARSVCYELKDFQKVLKDAKPGDSIIPDEGAIFLFSREAMNIGNRLMTKLLTIVRQKRIHICICIPNFFLIDSYVRNHRTGTLIYVKKRGHYKAFTGKAIQIVSKEGAKTKQIEGIKVPNGTFWEGDFCAKFIEINDLNQQTYDQQKEEHLNRFINEIGAFCASSEDIEAKYVSMQEACKLMQLTRHTLYKLLESGEIPGKKFGSKWFIEKDFIAKKTENPREKPKTTPSGDTYTILEGTAPPGGAP